jgi:hypothetical protein
LPGRQAGEIATMQQVALILISLLCFKELTLVVRILVKRIHAVWTVQFQNKSKYSVRTRHSEPKKPETRFKPGRMLTLT